jgi:hypothetical protein
MVAFRSIRKAAPAIPQDMRVSVDGEKIARLKAIFEKEAIELDGVEVWLARDLQRLLGYTEWRNFLNVVARAKESCERAGAVVEEHFVDVNKVIERGNGAKDSIQDIALTRYACYLVAQKISRRWSAVSNPKKKHFRSARHGFRRRRINPVAPHSAAMRRPLLFL